MNNEIIAGLRNAIARGESIDKAKKSFLNSGYNPQEVEAACNIIMNGVSDVIYPTEDKSNEKDDKTQQTQKELPPLPILKKKNKKKNLIIVLIIILFAILGAGGYLIYLLL